MQRIGGHGGSQHNRLDGSGERRGTGEDSQGADRIPTRHWMLNQWASLELSNKTTEKSCTCQNHWSLVKTTCHLPNPLVKLICRNNLSSHTPKPLVKNHMSNWKRLSNYVRDKLALVSPKWRSVPPQWRWYHQNDVIAPNNVVRAKNDISSKMTSISTTKITSKFRHWKSRWYY